MTKHERSYKGRRMVTMSSIPEISDKLFTNLDRLMSEGHIFNERGDISLSVFLRMLGWWAEEDFYAALAVVREIGDKGSFDEANYRLEVNPRRGNRNNKVKTSE